VALPPPLFPLLFLSPLPIDHKQKGDWLILPPLPSPPRPGRRKMVDHPGYSPLFSFLSPSLPPHRKVTNEKTWQNPSFPLSPFLSPFPPLLTKKEKKGDLSSPPSVFFPPPLPPPRYFSFFPPPPFLKGDSKKNLPMPPSGR